MPSNPLRPIPLESRQPQLLSAHLLAHNGPLQSRDMRLDEVPPRPVCLFFGQGLYQVVIYASRHSTSAAATQVGGGAWYSSLASL
jgi:hypothetical protein